MSVDQWSGNREAGFVSATVDGTGGRRFSTGGRRAFPAGTGSEEPSVLNKADSGDVAEQALRALHTEQLRHRIREVLAALPADQRQAVKLHLFEGMSDGEIAPLLGVTAQRASQLWRAGFATLWSALRDGPVSCLEDGESATGSWLQPEAPVVEG
jgi:RNA polymerase sigma factor (sigma-70 family)